MQLAGAGKLDFAFIFHHILSNCREGAASVLPAVLYLLAAAGNEAGTFALKFVDRCW